MDEQSLERIPRLTRLDVAKGQQPERIDVYITQAVLGATRNKVQEAITAGAITVNGTATRANYKVRPGDVIEITLMKPPPIELVAQDIPLDIMYEDDDILIVNKPAGMVTHPAYGNRDGTLVNAVLFHVGGSLPAVIDISENEEIADEDDIDEELLDEEIADEEVDDDEAAGEEVADEQDIDNDVAEKPEQAEASDEFAAARPGVVHRLDKDTSGLMVVAKNAESQFHLSKQFAERTIKREYWAVAWGIVKEDDGEIEGNIARDTRDRKKFAVSKREGKYALTRYHVLERYDFATLVSLRLATGRTHQIRVHAAHIGNPIFGDATYGGRSIVYPGHGGRFKGRISTLLKLMGRQALHAKTLGLVHPRTGEWMEFDSELPEDFQKLVDELRKM